MSDKRYYGIYEGICVDNEDPKNLSRISVQVPQLAGESVYPWARACLPVTDNANHPDHKKHLASEVAALLNAHATHATHSGTLTTSSNGSPSHTHTITYSLAHDAHTNNHTGKTPDSTYYLDHPHEDTTDTLDKDGSESGSPAAEHTYHRAVPNIGQKVWVMFIAGDPNFPVWMGVQI